MLSTATSDAVKADLDFHLQNASKAFWKHKWVLCDKNVSLAHRLEFFQAVVSPVACFASGHRAVHTQHLHKMDVEFRRLLRRLVGPPGGVDWSLPWHQILHSWNERVRHCCERFGIETWSTQCWRHYWRLASYIALLPSHRWVKRVLQWDLPNRAKPGSAKMMWDEKVLSQVCQAHA